MNALVRLNSTVAFSVARTVKTQQCQSRKLTTIATPSTKVNMTRDLFGLTRASSRPAAFHTTSVARSEQAKIPVWTARKESIKTAKNINFELYEATQWGLAICVPLAFILSPSALNFPVDLALGVMIPYHMYSGCHHIFEDYFVNFSFYKTMQSALWVIVILTVFGLTLLNLKGIGITESIKRLWRDSTKKADKKH